MEKREGEESQTKGWTINNREYKNRLENDEEFAKEEKERKERKTKKRAELDGRN